MERAVHFEKEREFSQNMGEGGAVGVLLYNRWSVYQSLM